MPTSPYTVIYSFGDSLSDAGDAYLLTTSTAGGAFGLSPEPVNPPYYAEGYAAAGGGTLTGDLFSNGPVWVQDLAATLGLATPGPGEVGQGTPFGYAQIVAGAANGTDFAIGGSVTGPTSFNTGAAVTLTDLSSQIVNFQNEVSHPASTALYTVWSGSNDLLNLFGASNFATLAANGMAAADVTASVNNEISAIQSLVAIGAQTILVPDVPDLGVIPLVTAEGAAAETTAANLAQSFDAQLINDLATEAFGTAKIKVVDTYGLIANAVMNPAAFGLTNSTGSVYTGSFTSDDAPLAATGAAQNQYLFFDKMHPTEAGQMAVASAALTALGIACYARGTHIAVPGGEALVEELAIGDSVLTASGMARAVRWIGRRSYAGRFLAGNCGVQPIRFRAGSLGGGLPRRDLLVSPEHAMLLDGMLIPANCLLNGTSIVQERGLRSVDYVHVELESHDVILAEGAASETFLDDFSRAMFHNAAEFAVMYPDAVPGVFCARRVTEGEDLEAVRQKLPAMRVAA